MRIKKVKGHTFRFTVREPTGRPRLTVGGTSQVIPRRTQRMHGSCLSQTTFDARHLTHGRGSVGEGARCDQGPQEGEIPGQGLAGPDGPIPRELRGGHAQVGHGPEEQALVDTGIPVQPGEIWEERVYEILDKKEADGPRGLSGSGRECRASRWTPPRRPSADNLKSGPGI